MSDEHETPSDLEDRRGAVARLAEALAAAQRVAREVDADPAGDVADPSGNVADPSGDPDGQGPHAEAAADGPDVGISAQDTEQRDDATGPVVPVVDAAGSDPDPVVGDRSEPESGEEAVSASVSRRLWPLHVVMGVLIVAVPVLAYVGYRLTSDSTSGEVLSGRSEPDAPGYLALVEPTPVALVIHTADDGSARDLTILSLSGPDQKGGAIIGVPVRVRLDEDFYGIDQFTGTIEKNRAETAARVIGAQLGLGFGEAVKVTDSELVRSVEPVAPLRVDNPEPVTTPDGETFEAGPLELPAERIPAYLDASDAGNTTSGSLSRQRLVWAAWVEAIATSPETGVVPGERSVGLGRFLSGLADGEVQTASFPVLPAGEDDGGTVYEVDRHPADLLIANAVPFPVAAEKNDRATVALVNGTGPEAAPPSVIQRLTYAGAQITTTGNARRFDHDQTVLIYADRSHRGAAQRMADELGVGRPERSDNADSGADIRIVMGSDLLKNPPAPLTSEEIDTP